MVLLKLGALGLLVLVALKATSTFRHVSYLFNPALIPDPYVQQDKEHTGTCDVPMVEIKTFTGVHDFETVTKMISAHNEPLLFKGYIKNPVEKWADIEATVRDVPLAFDKMELNGFGNMWLSGVTKTGQYTNATIREVLDSTFDPNDTTALYSSFSTFLDLDSPTLKDEATPTSVLKDTNFVSNFPRDILATSLHSAPTAASFSIQYLGRKLWLLASPHHMENFDLLSTPPTNPLAGSEKQYFDILRKEGKGLLVVPQEEGDLFYFPPLWGHAVVTKAGPNVMLNFRRISILQPFLAYPLRFIEVLTSSMVMSTTFNDRRKSGTDMKFREYSYPYRHAGKNYDSGCSDQWKAILNRPVANTQE